MLILYRPSLRVAGAIAVLFTWLGSLGWLAARRINQTEETTLSSQATLRLAPGTVWYAVYSGQTQVGNAAITLDTLSPGYRVSEAVMLESPDGVQLVRSTRRTDAWLGATLRLTRIRTDLSREGRLAGWNVVIAGDTVTAHFASSATRTQGRTQLGEPTTTIAIPYRLALGGGLTPGRTRTMRLLEGWPLGGGIARISVAGDSMIHFADSARTEGSDHHWVTAHADSVRAFAVVVDGPGGPRRLWIDHRGSIAGVETTFGLRWVRTDFDLSETAFRKALPQRTDSIRASFAPISQYAARNVAPDTSTEERRFLVQRRDGSPIDTALLRLLAGGRQSVEGDTITVHTAPTMRSGEGVKDSVQDPMIQHDAGAIQKVQRMLVTEPLNRERLPAFIAAFSALVRVDTALGSPEDALSTLGAKRGRPDGITRLFVAFLRASGVPSRYVIGIYPQHDTLLTHSWAEIWSENAGGWYAVDPVSSHARANSGLIRLAFGGSSHPDEMLAMLANARLTEIGRKGKR